MIAINDQVISTKIYKKYILKDAFNKCREKSETIQQSHCMPYINSRWLRPASIPKSSVKNWLLNVNQHLITNAHKIC